MHKVAADTQNALKTAVEVSVAAALPVDTTMKKQRNSSILCMPFLCHRFGVFFFFWFWVVFFLSTELTIITMISVLVIQTPM